MGGTRYLGLQYETNSKYNAKIDPKYESLPTKFTPAHFDTQVSNVF